MKRFIVALMATGALSAAVEDGAALFSPGAVAAANKKLADIKTSTAKEIVILTTADLGGKAISEYTRQQALARKLNGVIVVISTKPRMLEVVSGRKTAIIFNRDQTLKVRNILSKNLRKKPDAALAETVGVFYDVFSKANAAMIVADDHRSPAPAAHTSSSGSFGWLKWIVIIGVVLLIIRLIGYFMSRNAAQGAGGAPAGTPGGFGGGGFFPSLMGGIFGAMAGSYIYDKFFSDHNDHSSHANDSRNDSSSSDWRGDDNGETGSGSGSSSWGNDSDSGGGDSGGGGGDSGGGDW